MQNKLQELTDRLYSEGLAKGQEEGRQILSKAEDEAARIVAQANEKAAAIVAKAGKDADDMRVKAESDIKMAAAQALQATKQDIENLVIAKICDEKVSKDLQDTDLIKEMVRAVAANFADDGTKELSVVLPVSLKDKVSAYVSSELGKSLAVKMDVSFSKKIAGGFTIGPKDGGYFISLSDESFRELIGAYLRPVTKKLLFG